MSEQLEKDNVPFAYEVRYSRRRTLALYVYPDQRVELRAPRGCPEHVLQAFLVERRDWVERQLQECDRRPPRRFSLAEPQPYLGHFYPLSLHQEPPYGVWLAAGRLQLRCRSPEEAPRLLAGWYRRQAETVFAARLAACHQAMAWLQLAVPRLRLRRMRSRWGSCSSHGSITLNLELIRYPLRLIDYVLVHELCHLREFHHGPAFYRLMDAVLPDWPQRRQELRALAGRMPPWPDGGG